MIISCHYPRANTWNCSSKWRALSNFVTHSTWVNCVSEISTSRKKDRPGRVTDVFTWNDAFIDERRKGDTFFFLAMPLSLARSWNSRHYPRAVFTSEPRNKDHMYTSVSRETLSLDSYYRWWLIIRVYAFVVI